MIQRIDKIKSRIKDFIDQGGHIRLESIKKLIEKLEIFEKSFQKKEDEDIQTKAGKLIEEITKKVVNQANPKSDQSLKSLIGWVRNIQRDNENLLNVLGKKLKNLVDPSQDKKKINRNSKLIVKVSTHLKLNESEDCYCCVDGPSENEYIVMKPKHGLVMFKDKKFFKFFEMDTGKFFAVLTFYRAL